MVLPLQDSVAKLEARLGEWHHIVATYDEEMLHIYVDGEPDGQNPRNTTPDNNDAPLTFAAVGTAGGTPLTGALDDIGLFDVALEEDDIREIMEKGLKEVLRVGSVSPSGRLISIWGHIKSGQN